MIIKIVLFGIRIREIKCICCGQFELSIAEKTIKTLLSRSIGFLRKFSKIVKKTVDF